MTSLELRILRYRRVETVLSFLLSADLRVLRYPRIFTHSYLGKLGKGEMVCMHVALSHNWRGGGWLFVTDERTRAIICEQTARRSSVLRDSSRPCPIIPEIRQANANQTQ